MKREAARDRLKTREEDRKYSKSQMAARQRAAAALEKQAKGPWWSKVGAAFGLNNLTAMANRCSRCAWICAANEPDNSWPALHAMLCPQMLSVVLTNAVNLLHEHIRRSAMLVSAVMCVATQGRPGWAAASARDQWLWRSPGSCLTAGAPSHWSGR